MGVVEYADGQPRLVQPRLVQTDDTLEDQEESSFTQPEEKEAPEIQAPSDPEVNPEIYKDVESLIFRGFLVKSANINGVPFAFKSLNHREFEFLQWIGEGSDWKDHFIAHSCWLIGGISVLADRPKRMSALVSEVSSMSESIKNVIVHHLMTLLTRVNRSIRLVEAYSLESYSRYRWAQLKGTDLMSPSVTGIAGTEHLGLNWAQMTWRALNDFQDKRDVAERDWDNAKFIGSCMAGKGIRKIYRQDEERRNKERQERFERKDRIIREARFNEVFVETQDAVGVKIVARTAEDLARIIEKELKGEKDWHDLAIEAEEKRQAEEAQQRQHDIREVYMEVEKPAETPSDPLRSYSLKEIEQFSQKKKERQEAILQKLAERESRYALERTPTHILPITKRDSTKR